MWTLSSQAITDFFWKDSTYCHGCFGKLVIDGGLENKNIAIKLAKKYEVKKVVISTYQPKLNGIINYGH